MITKQSSIEQLIQLAKSNDDRNFRKVEWVPAGPCLIRVRGILDDDTSIPNQPRERLPRLCFENVVVREDASVEEMRQEFHGHAHPC